MIQDSLYILFFGIAVTRRKLKASGKKVNNVNLFITWSICYFWKFFMY